MAFSEILNKRGIMRNRLYRILSIGMIITLAASLAVGCSGCTKQSAGDVEVTGEDGGVAYESVETVCEPIQNCTMDGVIYYQLNPEEYNETSAADIVFGEITKDSIDEGKVKLTLPVTITMKGKYTADCMDYSGCITPSLELADRYTSVIFPVNTGVGDGSYNYGGTIRSNNNKSVEVSYTCDYNVRFLGWNNNGDDTYTRDIVYNVVYTVIMPSDYDGLALKVAPNTQYKTGVSAASGVTTYVQDDYPEGTRVFRIE